MAHIRYGLGMLHTALDPALDPALVCPSRGTYQDEGLVSPETRVALTGTSCWRLMPGYGAVACLDPCDSLTKYFPYQDEGLGRYGKCERRVRVAGDTSQLRPCSSLIPSQGGTYMADSRDRVYMRVCIYEYMSI